MELRTQGEASWRFSSVCDISYFSACRTCIPEVTNVKDAADKGRSPSLIIKETQIDGVSLPQNLPRD
ncbi:rCG41745 [Rattus norvegicus]|uniref:RCG41745 n=1 Tax=Rattus norvegicus TaxID=10116 RepID=A6KRD6_RAT|nr:rCG41745 [Rattus norvegicus]